ncbi:MAG: U32 family peptidase [Gammaproteobacteria bacterium]|jgi:putative protease|nr:U32 family peptidase [Gammaproteobacteria bacterium]|tara:strand:- start:3610 stop:4914 length:1305 start_codon:yes stop_codon:yes gene_type:complete
MQKPELLSPAGTVKHMRYAFAYGSDAVYAGQPRYSLRVRNNQFKETEILAGAIDEAHRAAKQFYVASNISPHNDKVKSYLKDLEPVIEMQPDALIMSDPGLIMLVREKFPDMAIHLSVQSNAVNWATVRFWQQQGLTRVILSRELSLEEIEDIRQKVPDMELEVFVHGALCIAYSGRCLLSGYMTHRDSNQGACTNSCRWKYQAHEATENETGELLPLKAVEREKEPAFLLQEEGRPGEYMPAYEDEFGTYIMNSKDLRAVQHVARFCEMGIRTLKIEGRTKSHYYVARTAQVYRRAIEEAVQGKDFDMQMMDDLQTLANRGYTEGFYRRHPPAEYQGYDNQKQPTGPQRFVGEVIDANEDWLTIDVKNRFEKDETLQLMTPSGNLNFELTTLENKDGHAIDVAPGSGHLVQIRKPVKLSVEQLEYGLLVRDEN